MSKVTLILVAEGEDLAKLQKFLAGEANLCEHGLEECVPCWKAEAGCHRDTGCGELPCICDPDKIEFVRDNPDPRTKGA